MNLNKNTTPCCNDIKINSVSEKFKKNLNAYIPGTCPLTQQLAMLNTSISISCGKCVPCSEGLKQLSYLLEKIINTDATCETLEELKKLASTIKKSADCAIGYDAANSVLEGIEVFQDEYAKHIQDKNCSSFALDCAPCVAYCPANVDIPGYIALIKEGQFNNAVELIRNDNPFPTTCAYICEHPCEEKCRRQILDDAINIRGLKRYAVDNYDASKVDNEPLNADTGKNIAIVGGGPSGLSAAYFLSNMGHSVRVFEGKNKLGGMLRYGIPNYRLPKNRLDKEIDLLLNTDRINVELNSNVDKNKFSEIVNDFDAVYISIGAQVGKMLNIEGADAAGVYSAVDVLNKIGNNKNPDYSGKKVAVIGGGNVAMDAARSAVRCGASEVSIVYRRRKEDMTALQSEIDSAIEEGVELLTLHAPKEIVSDGQKVCSLIATPQMIGPIGKDGRPKPVSANKSDIKIDCDIVLLAIGQAIDSSEFDTCNIDARRNTFISDKNMNVSSNPKVFAGGDCLLGPSTVIRSIANGKIAAQNIDKFLGYNHRYKRKIDIPVANANNRELFGRVNTSEIPAKIRKTNFEEVENCMSEQEAMQECNKCLRCDHFGCNSVEGHR